jgi:hypothetical protein
MLYPRCSFVDHFLCMDVIHDRLRALDGHRDEIQLLVDHNINP